MNVFRIATGQLSFVRQWFPTQARPTQKYVQFLKTGIQPPPAGSRDVLPLRGLVLLSVPAVWSSDAGPSRFRDSLLGKEGLEFFCGVEPLRDVRFLTGHVRRWRPPALGRHS